MSIADNEGEIPSDNDNKTTQPERCSTRSIFGHAPPEFSDSQYSSFHSVIKAVYAQGTLEYSGSDATVATPQYNIKKGLTILERRELRQWYQK